MTQRTREKTDHIDANTAAAWFDGELADHERHDIHDHLDSCDDCRMLFLELGRAFDGDSPREPTPGADADRSTNVVPAPIAIGQRIDRYVVIEWLGGGGMGVVYGAYDPELERGVALKVLRAGSSDGDEDGAQRRLLKEAQALARISHPNVIAVFDAGTHEGQVFLAMEHLKGGTLAQWLAKESRSWQAILARFLDAGRGLAAAHASGMIHRDFKPSNVILGADDRVRVTDFGLASTSDDDSASPDERSFVGTPAYMSPEQRARHRLDARSDQYSFCVALHEALLGELPSDPPKDRLKLGAPTRVRSALTRGLSENPENRFGSMDDLLAELAPERAPLRRQILAGGAVVACILVASASYFQAQATSAKLCHGAENELTGIWDAPRKEAISKAFAATHAAYADDAWHAVETSLDTFSASWTRMHTEACEATRIRGDQSEELMDLRMACLANQARELKALTDLFASADAKVVEKSVSATYALPNVAACADIVALRSHARSPVDPGVRSKVDELRRELARAVALGRVAQYSAALTAARPLLDPAKATGDSALVSDVEYEVGRNEGRLGNFATGDAILYDAVDAAELASDDLAKGKALVQLTYNLGEREAKYDEATHAGNLAAAVLTRTPDEIDLRAKLQDDLAYIDDGRGHYADGMSKAEQALAMREKAFGPTNVLVGMSLNNASKSLYLLGDIEKALTYQRRAATIEEAAQGPHHPDLALALRNLGLSEFDLKHPDDAIRDVTRALAIYRESVGDDHPDTARTEGVLAMILNDQGKSHEALPHAEIALARLQKALPPDHPDIVNAQNTLGKIQLALGRVDDAIATHTAAVTICGHLGDPPNETGEALHCLGESYLQAHRIDPAITALERALTLREKGGDKTELADTRFDLAKALRVSGTDRARSITLGEQARDGYGAQRGYEKEHADVVAWLAANSP